MAPIVIPNTVRRGNRSMTVARMQNLLGVKPTGVFDEFTEVAVIVFQLRSGLVPNGIVGPHTWLALFALPPRPKE